MDLLKEVVETEECSILFSTHIISDLEKVADKVIFIDKGKIIFEKKKSDLINDYVKILNNDNPGIEDIMLHHVKGGLE